MGQFFRERVVRASAFFFLAVWVGASACAAPAPTPGGPTGVAVTARPAITTIATHTSTVQFPTSTRAVTPTQIPATQTRTMTATRSALPTLASNTITRAPTFASNDAALAQLVTLIHERFAEERAQRGLPPLARDSVLESVARARSQDMIARNYFSHTDPVTNANLVTPLLEQANYRWGMWGENIIEQNGAGVLNPTRLAKEFASKWLGSPGHAENILEPKFSRTGIGAAMSSNGLRIVVTQIFAEPL